MGRFEVEFEVGEEYFVVWFFGVDDPFFNSSIINMVVAVFDVDFATVFGRHGDSIG